MRLPVLLFFARRQRKVAKENAGRRFAPSEAMSFMIGPFSLKTV
jgi:hypothetical protein